MYVYFEVPSALYEVCLACGGSRGKDKAHLGLAGLELQKRQPKLAAAGDVRHRCAECCPGRGRVARDAVLEPGQLHVQVRPEDGAWGRGRKGRPGQKQARRIGDATGTSYDVIS